MVVVIEDLVVQFLEASAAYTMLTFCLNGGLLGQMVPKYGKCSKISRVVQNILMSRGASLLPEAG